MIWLKGVSEEEGRYRGSEPPLTKIVFLVFLKIVLNNEIKSLQLGKGIGPVYFIYWTFSIYFVNILNKFAFGREGNMPFNEAGLAQVISEIRVLIGQDNEALTDDEVEDFAKISLLFRRQNFNLIDEQLNVLEEQLKLELELQKIDYKTFISRLKWGVKQDKFFSDFLLRKWPEENGFNSGLPQSKEMPALPASAPTIKNTLSPQLFGLILKYRYFFKDIGAIPKHGEFTHALQWYILVELNKKYKFLKNSPLDLYAKLAQPSLCGLKQDKENSNPLLGVHSLWDYLFDDDLVKSENGSGVFFWLEYICNKNKDKYPLSAALLSQRKVKRESEMHAPVEDKKDKEEKRSRKRKLEVRDEIGGMAFWKNIISSDLSEGKYALGKDKLVAQQDSEFVAQPAKIAKTMTTQ